MKLISGSVMVFKSIEFHAKNIKFRLYGSSGGNMPKIWCRLKKTIIEGVEAAQIFDRLLIKSLLQFYEAMSLSLHSAPLLLKVLIQIRSSLENVWFGAKLCRSFSGTRIHCIDGSCWSIPPRVNCIEYRVNGFHNKCKWSSSRHLSNPHNGNRFPPR